MELIDLAQPLLASVKCFDDAAAAFAGADVVFFLGAFPRRDGMTRRDMLAKNVAIFAAQGRALAAGAAPGVRCCVVVN